MQKNNEAEKEVPENGEEAPATPDNVSDIKQGGGEVEKLQADLKAAKDQLLRALADAENARKRGEKEREEALKYANANFARDILNVSDNLRRAMDAVKKDELEANPALKNFVFGVEITEKELLSAFEKHGIKKIEPKVGEPFDYNRHQAMFEVESADKPSGVIMQVMQPGYIVHDRLLRPALVGVSKTPAAPQEKVDMQA